MFSGALFIELICNTSEAVLEQSFSLELVNNI